MKVDKRIWKTAVLAAVITVVGSVFVMRLDEWSKGLNSGFIVYGQTGTSGGPTGGTTACSSASGTSTVCFTKAIPVIVYSGKYKTAMEIINAGTASVSVSGNFYTSTDASVDGKASAATYSVLDAAAKTTSFTNGILPPTSLPGGAVLVVSVQDGPQGTGPFDWGMISATGAVTVSTIFAQREPINGKGDKDDAGQLDSFVGVPASPIMKQFLIPRVRHVGNSLDTGYAVVNTSSVAQTITVTVLDATGKTIAGPKNVVFRPLSQKVQFVHELFPDLKDDKSGTLYQYMMVSATDKQIAAVALANEGANLASVPVEQIQ